MRRVVPVIILILALIGFLDSIYLTLAHYEVFGPKTIMMASACPLRDGGCETLEASEKSYTFGIPNAILGSTYFAFLLGVVGYRVYTGKWLAPRLFLAFLVAGLLFSVYLLVILLVVINIPCPYCIAAHTVNISIVILYLLSLYLNRVPIGQ